MSDLVSLPGTAQHVLPTSANGRTYQLSVGLPASYAAAPERRYPVVYLTDAYWDFPLVLGTAGNLCFDGVVPECIVVGIGYPGEALDYEALRSWDLTAVPGPPYAGAPDVGGGAGAFLEVVAAEVIPFVERTYRADPARRVLVGSSLGGLFGLYALLSRAGLFQAIVAASPAVLWAHDWLLDLERQAYAAGVRPTARLFLSGAELEWPEFLASTRRLDARLRERAYPGLTYAFRIIDGERHAGTKAEAFTRGLRFAFGDGYPSPSTAAA